MRRWLRELDEHSASLTAALADAARLMRATADDPDQVEAGLRDGLRQAAGLVERLSEGQAQLIAFNRRMSIRFGLLGTLFLLLAALNVARLVF